jgi:hypothetical protein
VAAAAAVLVVAGLVRPRVELAAGSAVAEAPLGQRLLPVV